MICCWWCRSHGEGEIPAVSQLTTDQQTPMCERHLTAWYVLLDSLASIEIGSTRWSTPRGPVTDHSFYRLR